MKRAILVLVCAAVAVSYPTDSPISEPPNIALASPDDMDNSIENMATLVISEDDDCESEKSMTSVSIKRADEQDQPPPGRRRCTNRNFVRLGRGNSVDPVSELDLSGEKDTDILRPGRGGRSNDNFIRFGRSGRNDNFIRFGRGKQDFVRFGRDRSDNFIRFGRGRTDNFIRFGRGRPDNFIRFGRGKSDNFIRFGRGKPDNFIRFGRGKPDNFIRFGRGIKGSNFVRFGRDQSSNLEDTGLNSEDEFSLRVGRGGLSDSNFIRFGRARPGSSNFIRLGRGNDEIPPREEKSQVNGNFVRSGSQTYDDNFVRPGRSSVNNNELRRGKLTDRNFIRLGRSGQYDDIGEEYGDDGNALRLGRSDNPGNSRNFIRLGKRAKDSDSEYLARFGRDVEQIEDTSILSPGEPTQIDTENKTTTEEYQHTRTRRSITFPGEDEVPEDSSDYPIMISNNAYDDDKMATSTLDDSQIPFRYYSPLANGIPNYILGPELSVLAPLSTGAEAKRGKVDGHNRNYIRLG